VLSHPLAVLRLLTTKYSGSALQQLHLPQNNLVLVYIEALRQLRRRLFAFDGLHDHFRLEPG
jgi:hypothetical protein